MKFQDLGIDKNILRALTEVGYDEPTPIQQKGIPPVLNGYDLLGCAQTGTGKTCAFAVPIIQHLSREKEKGVRALILTPTRELALQIYENVCQYGRYTSCMAAVIYGGVSQVPQVEAIRRGADVLIATPGRLWDLMQQGVVKLDRVEIFVLDEADRMLDMGFFPDVKRIIGFVPDKRQTLLFSATIPKEIASLADSLLHNPVRIAITPSAKPVETIDQQLYFVEKAQKRELLTDIIRQKNVAQTLVFTRTKHGADRVTRDLNRAGIKSRAIHGDKSQGARQTALKEFKECKIAALVATDIAARGIDISDLPLVINYDLPNMPETYVHRIGRTGRAGQDGTAISFCDRSERPYLADIEKLIGKKIPVEGEIEAGPADTAVVAAAPRAGRNDGRGRRTSGGTAAPHARRAKTEQSAQSQQPQPPQTRNRRAKAEPQTQQQPSQTRSRRAKAEPQTQQQPSQTRSRRAKTEPQTQQQPSQTRSRRARTEPQTQQQPAQTRSRKPAASPRRAQAQQAAEEQQAKKAAPARRGRSTAPGAGGRMRGGRRGNMRDFDRNEPRVDAATPVHADALSAEAMERIRKKVAGALANRGAGATAPKTQEKEKTAPRARSSRGRKR